MVAYLHTEYAKHWINSFHAKAPSMYPLKTSEKQLLLSGCIEKRQWLEIDKKINMCESFCNLTYFNKKKCKHLTSFTFLQDKWGKNGNICIFKWYDELFQSVGLMLNITKCVKIWKVFLSKLLKFGEWNN